MTTNRLWRTLSAFHPPTRTWVPVSASSAAPAPPSQLRAVQRLSLTSWNVHAFPPRPVARVKHILERILEPPSAPDVVFLQEVTPDVRAFLLHDSRVRAAFLATDAEDETSFENMPFATMALLSRARFSSSLVGSGPLASQPPRGEAEIAKLALGRVFRVGLPSKYGRDALCVDVLATPRTSFRLINVHLDSLGGPESLRRRAQQMAILAGVLREPGCGGGVIAGDFNAISPADDALVEENGLVDAWVALHGRAHPGGATWGVSPGRVHGARPGRLDKVVFAGESNLAEEMTVLRPGFVEVPRPGMQPVKIPWSDHSGLRCVFTI